MSEQLNLRMKLKVKISVVACDQGLVIKIQIFVWGGFRRILKVLSMAAELSRVPHKQEILFTGHRK